MRKYLSKILLLLFACGAILSVFGVIIPLWSISPVLPPLSTFMSRSLLDRNGHSLQIPLNPEQERAEQIKSDEIPEALRQAFLLSEDKRFFEHPGVDPAAILRAIAQTISEMRPVSGASTISMQLARILWPQLATPKFKIAQMVQAMRLEMHYSKEKILHYYFNLVPFSRQVVGLKRACAYFFDKTCQRLSLAESATLAVLPRSPSRYLKNKDALRKARNRLLQKLIPVLNATDSVSSSRAFAEPIRFEFKRTPASAFHFVRQVFQEKHIGITNIRTTLDLPLQNQIRNLLRENIEKNPLAGNDGAVLVVENQTGNVLVYIGSPGYFIEDFGMFDAIQARRSPGSALKPFVYAYALEQGKTLSSIIPDVPAQFKLDHGVFSPDNYGGNFSGPRQLRFALANSKNIPVLFLTADLGKASVLDFLRNSGFQSLSHSSEHYGIGVSLGNGEVSLWELVQAYGTLARGGIYKPLKILVNSPPKQERQILSEETAYLISDVLSDPQARAEEFGRNGSLEFDFKVSVKTGTSAKFRDRWTVGYTSEHTLGVWKGNADGSSPGIQISASEDTGPIFQEIVKLLYSGRVPAAIPIPEKIVSKRVCSLNGAPADTTDCENTRIELFQKDRMPQASGIFYRKKQVENCNGKPRQIHYIEFPPEYRDWAKASRQRTLDLVLREQCGRKNNQEVEQEANNLQIIRPVSGAIFALDPTIPGEHQKLRIELERKGGKNEQLIVNGELFAKTTGKTFVDWPLQKGRFYFQLKTEGNFPSSKVFIEVF